VWAFPEPKRALKHSARYPRQPEHNDSCNVACVNQPVNTENFMIKSMRIVLGTLGVLAVATSGAMAAPITQSEGTANILGNTYDVSVIFDPTGDSSFNELLPTITFTAAADALAAGDALKTQFGSSFDWNPFTTNTGGRIVFGATGSNYDFTSVCVTESGCSATAANGPLTLTQSASNAFTFIQFSAVTAVPEPLTLSLFAAGVAGLASFRRRKEKRAWA